MSKIYIKLHYFCILSIILMNSYNIFNRPIGRPKYIWILAGFSDSTSPLILGTPIFFCSILITLLNIIRSNFLLRILNLILFLALISFKYSFGKIDHMYHIWIVSSFFFIFYKENKLFKETKNVLLLKIVQTWLLLQYFSSGLWKLRSISHYTTLEEVRRSTLEQLAYSIAQSNWPMNKVRIFLVYESYWSIIIGFFLVLLFQIYCGISALTQKNYLICGVSAILFHISTGVFLGVWYWGTAFASAFYLIVSVEIKRNCEENSFLI